MRMFVARQPIFNLQRQVWAYELLFRNGPENCFPKIDGDVASARLIDDSLSVFGFWTLSEGKQVSVNLTKKVLCERLYSILPPKHTIIEILETVRPDDETLAACREARHDGYTVALDDFDCEQGDSAFLEFADLIKVDFRATKPEERQRLIDHIGSRKINLLAEKVETEAEVEQAIREGFTSFQGYFFARPEMVSRDEVPPLKMVYLELLRELHAPELVFERVEQVIKRDVGLSIRLLRYLNSSYFGLRSQVTSLRQALVLLGEDAFRKWASVISLVGIGFDKVPELIVTCLIRARFCELLAEPARVADRRSDLFLVGMLSAVDALMGRPLPEVLKDIAVSNEVATALTQNTTPLGKVRALVLAYEDADWAKMMECSAALGVPDHLLPELYAESLEWAAKVPFKSLHGNDAETVRK